MKITKPLHQFRKILFFVLILNVVVSCIPKPGPTPEPDEIMYIRNDIVDKYQAVSSTNDIVMSWKVDDKIVVFDNDEKYLPMILEVSEKLISNNGATVIFEMDGIISENVAMYAFSPADKASEEPSETVMDINGQKQTVNNSTDHIKGFSYLSGSSKADEDSLVIDMKLHTLLLTLELKAPAGNITPKTAVISVEGDSDGVFTAKKGLLDVSRSSTAKEISIDITGMTKNSGNKYIVNMVMFPFELDPNSVLNISVVCDKETFVYQHKFSENETVFSAGKRYVIDVAGDPVEYSDSEMKSYRVLFSLNGKDTYVDGIYNGDEILLQLPETYYSSKNAGESSAYDYPSYPFVDNLDNAVASFITSGTVTVKGTNQVTNVTANDYYEDLVYTVTDKSGNKKDYTVKIKTPQKSGLPVLSINTNDGKDILSKETYQNADFLLVDKANPDNNLSLTTEIRGRGNSTWSKAKKPYRIKLSSKKAVFGLGKAKSWALLANYLDPTYIMNSISFSLAKKMNEFDFTNTMIHVELYVNGQYRGNYAFTEHVQVDENRINIDEEEDFYIELDELYDEAYKFKSDLLNLPVNIKSPEFTYDVNSGPVDPRFTFIKDKFNELEAILQEDDLKTSDYEDLVDVKSLIDFILLNEIVHTSDVVNPRSFKMYYVKSEGKFYFGPPWDFDLAYGNYGKADWKNSAEVMFGKTLFNGKLGQQFLLLFFKDPDFLSAYKARWNEVKALLPSVYSEMADFETKLQESADFDRAMWHRITEFNVPYSTHISNFQSYWNKRVGALTTAIPAL